MGYRHSREDILGAATAVAGEEGLSALTFGRVAKRAGTSDRMVVYYFATKDELVGAVLGELAVQLQATLAQSLTVKAADHHTLVRIAWPLLATADADAVFALFFEALGLATAGREPFRSLVPVFVQGWIDWTAEYLTGTAARRRAEAEATIALLDGLLLMRQLAGPDAADRAARQLGIVGPVRHARG